MNIIDFIENFSDVIEVENISLITPETEFRTLAEWDSLSYLSVIAMIKDEYNVEIGGGDFKKLTTIRDIVNFIETH